MCDETKAEILRGGASWVQWRRNQKTQREKTKQNKKETQKESLLRGLGPFFWAMGQRGKGFGFGAAVK